MFMAELIMFKQYTAVTDKQASGLSWPSNLLGLPDHSLLIVGPRC